MYLDYLACLDSWSGFLDCLSGYLDTLFGCLVTWFLKSLPACLSGSFGVWTVLSNYVDGVPRFLNV